MVEFKTLEQLQQEVIKLDRAELREVQVGSYNPENYVAVWNTTRDELEGIILKKNSVLLQHKDVFNSFIKIATDINLAITGELKNHGGQVIGEFQFTNLNFKDPTNSNIRVGMRVENSYNKYGSPMFEAQGYGIRGVCNNGMVMYGSIGKIRAKHERLADLDKYMLEFIEKIFKSIEKLQMFINKANEDIFNDVNDAQEVIRGELHSKKLSTDVFGLLETRDNITRYTVYNAITQYATHNSEDELQKLRLHKVAERILIKPRTELSRKKWEDDDTRD